MNAISHPWAQRGVRSAIHHPSSIIPSLLAAALTLSCVLIASAQNARDFLGGLIGVGSNTVTTVGQKAMDKFLISVLPEDRKELTNGNVLVLQDGAWKPATTTNSQAAPKQYLVRSSSPESTQRRTLSRGPMLLDEKVVQDKVPGRLALEVLESPLPWDPQNQAYATLVKVGLQAQDPKNHKLDHPITINLSGNDAQLKPATLTIKQLGEQGFTSTTITCLRHDSAPRVILHSDWGERSFDVPVVPHTSKLKLSISETKLFGYGLGTAQLTVKRFAEDGRELCDSNALVVNITADHGKADSSTLTIPAGLSHAEVKLRSVGLGPAKIAVESDSLKDELAGVQFTFPLTYTLAALGGGCLGGLGRFFKQVKAGRNQKPDPKKNKAGQPKNNKSPARYISEGCVVGFLIVAAVAAGAVITHLPTTVVGTELGALVIATAAGFSGAPLLNRLKSVLGPFKLPRRALSKP
ncbi:MAG TPA: hypothetical protein VN578_12390 [Candidatus Binatia bacterium]|nr:hypothetical protein [Candidatus Binatia bacterium]